jgi:ABC-type uncharacterized transport system ATPase subunit
VERVKGVSFEIRAGEILGIAGVAGNGQTELLEVLGGMIPAQGGTVTLRNRRSTSPASIPTARRAAPAASARARGPSGRGPDHALRGLGKRGLRLSRTTRNTTTAS